MKRIFLITCFLLCGVALNAQSPTVVRLKLSQDTIMIGDQVTLSVEIDKDVAADLRAPDFKDGKMTDKIEVIGDPTLDTLQSEGRQMKLRLDYLITCFDAGDYSFKDFAIVSGVEPQFDTIRAMNDALLRVNTFEIDTTKQQIFDIKHPKDTPLSWAEVKPYLLWGGVGLLVLAAIIYGVVWYLRRRRAAQEAGPQLPIHVVALSRLDELHARKLWQEGHAKEYFSILTQIVRDYIGERYSIDAMEMTSAEIVAAVKELNTEKVRNTLRGLVELADLVKFAKLSPDGTECETAYFDAYYYVEQTKEIIIEETQEIKQ
ncbi:MAG: hypothetical protein RR980_03390 [Mucinivorans sp.]